LFQTARYTVALTMLSLEEPLKKLRGVLF